MTEHGQTNTYVRREYASIPITHRPGVASRRFAFFRRDEPEPLARLYLSLSRFLAGISRFESKRARIRHTARFITRNRMRDIVHKRECPVNESNAKGVKREGSNRCAF